jgi:DNA polymerase II large subunit
MKTDEYFKELEKKVKEVYAVAEEARKKGLDPVNQVEVSLATSLAEKAVRLIALIYPQVDDKKIIERILELEKQYGQLDIAVSFKIAEEIAKEKFCKFRNLLEAIDAGIRIGFAYTTLGVVSSPIEGYTELKLGKTRDGKDYFIANFSGPIRSAGTTAGCVVLMIIDYLREIFGFAKYDPDEKEVKRYVTENYDYHERVTNLQYLPTEEEIAFLAKNMPIQIDGEPSEKKEVSNYKDLPRVATNLIRGGMCLIFSEGLAQKAQKGLRLYKSLKEKGFQASGWDFLEEYVNLHKKREKGTSNASPTYIKDIVAGRPVFGYPSMSGGFRFRYGKSRTSGFSAVSVSPATMAISGSFLSVGTQLKVEKPTKGAAITSCDKIDGPIVRLKNGSVKKIDDFEEAKKLYNDVEEIIYLGDILFSLGDVINRNYELIKPGYVEEWWALELKKKSENKALADSYNINFEQAVKFSEKYQISLHPKYIFYWTQISLEDFLALLDWLGHGNCTEKIILPFSKIDQERFKKCKRALEILGVEHEVTLENVVLTPETSKALLVNLGINIAEGKSFSDCVEEVCKKIKENNGKGVLELVNSVSKYKIKDKAGTFIGARMGRPEKAKIRKLVGSPNVLFPIGEEGGRLRSVNVAAEAEQVFSNFPLYFCENCKKEKIYRKCDECGNECKKMYYCRECKNKIFSDKCEIRNHVCQAYMTRGVNIKPYFGSAIKTLQLLPNEVPSLIKGVRGTSSAEHDIENLTKGFLRSIFNLNVNKDGTIRYDATELPITHFKPLEIMTSVEKLKDMGYDKDINDQELESEDQILELKPHDIILPSCPDSSDERADDIFIRVAGFLDTLLLNLYGLKPFYKIQNKEDLIGQIGVCMAPHNCAGVISRIIGFSRTQGLLASPYMHAAMRRDCFDFNTYIPIKKNGHWRIAKIGEIIEKLNPQKKVDNYGTKEVVAEGFNTLGLNHSLSETKINNFTKHTKLPMYEIKTSLGKKIRVTENHKFLVDGKIKRASDLKIGDKLPLLMKIDIPAKPLNTINLINFFKNERDLMVRNIKDIVKNINSAQLISILGKLNMNKRQFNNYNLRDSYPINFVLALNEPIKKKIFENGKISFKRDRVAVPILINLEKDLLETIGLYVAEGYSRKVLGNKGLNQVYIASSEKELRDFVKKTIKRHFGLMPTERKNDRVTFSSKALYLFFTQILEAGSVARDKRVPYLFLDLPLDKLGAFLRGYFEGDGSAEKNRKKVSCDSVSEGLLNDLEFCLARFGIFAKRYEYEKEPGPIVRSFYERKGKSVPKFKITKLIIGSDFVDKFTKIRFLTQRKNKILESYKKIKGYGMKISYDDNFVYDSIVSISPLVEKESYCLNVDNKNHLILGNSIISRQCDGDEAAVMLLLDVLLNFSRKFLPSHRGGTQDAPLVLNARIRAGEVDDQILDLEMGEYPLELYELAEQGKHSSEVKIENVKKRLKEGKDPFTNLVFTHDCSNFNKGIVNSSYKYLPTMKEKVGKQMEVADKLRSLNPTDVAKLVIDRHFIRDIRGNLRKFSQQEFRCGKCNEKYRRPPLVGKCLKCGSKVIFTISQGSIIKYLEPALELAARYPVPAYMKQSLELTKSYIESIFGKESEKQVDLKKWF